MHISVLLIALLAAQPLELRLWTIPDVSSPSPDAVAAARVIELYRRQHPDITLRKTAGISIPQIGSQAAVLMAIAGDLAPDVLHCPQDALQSYVDQGFLLPLDDYLAQFDEEELYARAPRAVWDAARLRGKDGKLHTYAIPTSFSVTNLKIRRDLAAKLGYDRNDLPRTWNDLLAAARDMTDLDEGRYGFGLYKGDNLADTFYSLLVCAGGAAWNKRDDGSLEATFNSEAGVAAMDFLWKLHHVSYMDTSLYYMHKRGKFVMAFWAMSDTGMMRAADAARFLLLPMPTAPSGGSTPRLRATFSGVFAGQDDPRIRQAAFDYIWLTGSRDARRITAETLVEAEAPMHANPLDLEAFGYDEALAEFPDGYLDFYRDALQRGAIAPTGRGSLEIYRYMTNAVQQVFGENLDALDDDARQARIAAILDETAGNVNIALHAAPDATTARWRQAAALLLAVVMFAAFAWQFVLVQRAYAGKYDTGSRRPGRMPVATAMKITLILAPALLLVAVWEYYPLIRGTIIAFQNYHFLEGSTFVGVDNFVSILFGEPHRFWMAFGRTIQYVALSLTLGFLTPVFLAILLHEIPRGKVLFRVLYYLPALTSGIVVMFLWKAFYEPGPNGFLNYLLSMVRIAPKQWLDDPNLAMLCCVLPVVWAGVGPGSLIYLAALKSIPEQLYESASIDGCGVLGKVRHVALPYMKPLIIMNFIGVFIATFQTSGYVLVLTGGGPNDASMVLSLEIFYEAYARLNFGAATAMSWLLAFSLIGFTLFQIRYLSRLEFRSAATRT